MTVRVSFDAEGEIVWNASSTTGAAGLTVGSSAGASRVLWIWAPYVLAQASSRQAAFITALAGGLGVGASVVQRKLLGGDDDYIRDLVLNHKSELTRAYQAVSKDLNFTSLCLFSGPAPGRGKRSRHWRTRSGGVDRPEVAAWDIRPGWLGTGDAPLAAQKNGRRVGQVLRASS